MLSNEDEESPLAKVASIIGDVFDVVNSEKKDELFDAGNPTETITTRISRTDVWDVLSEFAILSTNRKENKHKTMLNFFVQKRAGGDGFMIEFQNVSKIFKTKECEVKALENVSLTIEDGDIYGIIGFSGAGKSTLIRTINALEVPTSGKVLVDGEDINALKQSKLRQKRKKLE